MNEWIKAVLKILLMIWSLLMISGTFLLCFHPEPMVLIANLIVLIWMAFFYIVADGTNWNLVNLVKFEFVLTVVYLLYTSLFTILANQFLHDIFGKYGTEALWFDCIGLLIHLLLFAFSRPGFKPMSPMDPLVVYNAHVDVDGLEDI